MKDLSVDPAEAEKIRRRRGRNWSVFIALLAFVALVYGITIVKITAGEGP